MPSVLTGANLANRDLIYLGVSGDGDSASIGLGQFAHCIRRGVNMLYIVENNGVYGLTKGQFSATADKGSKTPPRRRSIPTQPIDMVALALQLGATFVARSFSGDKHQLVPLIKAAIEHKGAAFIDVRQPCVAFNNHAGIDQELRVRARAQRGGEQARLHGRPRARSPPITRPARSRPSCSTTARCCACASSAADYDPHDRVAAMTYLQAAPAPGEVVTGLLYVEPEHGDLHHFLDTVEAPLNELGEAELCPGQDILARYNAAHR